MLLEGSGGGETSSSTSSDQDPDELLAELVRAEKEGAAPTEAKAAPEQAKPQGFEAPDWAQFEWNGKKIAPDSPDKAKVWISQGYNYSQRMGELNKQKAEAERLQQEWGEKIKRYEQIDGYIKENPTWWDHVNQQWETRLSPAQQQQQFQPGQIPQELQPILQPLLEKVSKVDEILAEREQEREAQALREAAEQEKLANENLDKEIESIRKKYPNIDLSSKDASEMTLETRVLKHANENSIPSFRAAFHDYMSDRLSELASANGREAAVKTRAEAAKKGILGTSPAPTKGITSPDNIKAKSNEDLKREALAELAAMGFT